jgi:hypothetical protein
MRALQLGLQIDQVLLQLRAPAHLFREVAAGSRKGSRSPTGFFPHAAQLRVRLLQLRRGDFGPLILCAQDRKILVHLSDIKPHRGSHPPTDTADAMLRMGHQFGAHIRHQSDALVNSQPIVAVIVPQSPVQHLGDMPHLTRGLIVG